MPRRKNDPFASFNFLLEIDAVTKAGFSEVTGLNAESNVIEYRDGNESLNIRKLPGLNKYGNVTLKTGVTVDTDLFEWFKNVMDGDIVRNNVSVVLLDEKREEQMRWNLLDAWPAKYVAPDFKASANEMAIETLEVCFENLEKA